MFPPEVWRYIKSPAFQLGEDVEVENKVIKRKVSRLVTNISISSVSFGVMENVETLKFDTEDGFSVVQKFFGMGSILGFRHRCPKYGDKKVIQRMDIMIVVFGEDCYVSFSYNTTSNRLGLVIQFGTFLFDFDRDGNLIDCPSSHLESYCSKFSVADKNSAENAVVVGAYFRRDNLTYEIESIHNECGGNAKICACVIEGANKDELHEFDDEYESIGTNVLDFYK